MLMFGSDGMLYLTIGDGGGSGDKFNNAQNRSTIFGKTLKLDVSVAATDSIKYRIPNDNPFIQDLQSLDEIFAYGLRNPWRCSMDRGQLTTELNRGRLFCGDVGQGLYEEIDIIENGGNYGWRAKEGLECYNSTECANLVGDTLPIFVYDQAVGRSVTGGYFYRGCRNAYLSDSYIFGDAYTVTDKVFTLKQGAGGIWANATFKTCSSEICLAAGLTNTYNPFPVSFAEDYQAELYVIARQFDGNLGNIFKLVDPISNGMGDCDYQLQL